MTRRVSRFRVVVLFVCCLAFLFAAPLASGGPAEPASSGPAEPAKVTIAGAAGGVLTFSTIEPQFDGPVLVQSGDASPSVREVQIDATSLVGPSGRIQEVKLRKDGTEFDGKLSVPALGRVTVHLAAPVPEEGAYTGEIGLLVDGKRQAIAIKVMRSAREVVIAGASGGTLQLTTPDTGLNWPITIRRNDNAPGTRDVGVELGPLVAPSGNVMKVALRKDNAVLNASLPLQGPGQVQVNLVGQLPEEGDYTGDIGLVVDGKRWSTALKIKRVMKDVPVSVEDLSQLRTTIDGAGVALRLHLRGTGAENANLYKPTLARLGRKEGSALVQASYRGVRVSLDNGTAAPDPIAIGPKQSMELTMLIEGLSEPGNYSGAIQVSSAERKPVEKSFEMSLRRCWWLAAALILAGVVFSTLIRVYVIAGRGVLRTQSDAAKMKEMLTQLQATTLGIAPDEQQIVKMLIGRLDAVSSGNSNPIFGTPVVQVDEIRRKFSILKPWIELRRKLDAVQPPEIGDDVRKKHRGVSTMLETAGTPKADTDKASSELAEWSRELEAALQRRLAQSIDALEKEIGGLPQAHQDALSPAKAALGQARRYTNNLQFDQAQTTLIEASHAYIREAVDPLRKDLATKPRPPGFKDDSEWKDFVTRFDQQLAGILAQSDSQKQIADWNQVRTEWLREVSSRLLSQVNAFLGAGAISNDAKKEFQDSKTLLESTSKALVANNMAEATKDYREAAEAYDRGIKKTPGVVRAGSGAATTDAAPIPEAPSGVLGARWLEEVIFVVLGPPKSQKEATRRIVVAEGILFLSLAIVAVVLGLKLLYFDNPSWGSYTDLMVALLWGFGLHQIGNSAFQGVQSLAKQIAGIS